MFTYCHLIGTPTEPKLSDSVPNHTYHSFECGHKVFVNGRRFLIFAWDHLDVVVVVSNLWATVARPEVDLHKQNDWAYAASNGLLSFLHLKITDIHSSPHSLRTFSSGDHRNKVYAIQREIMFNMWISHQKSLSNDQLQLKLTAKSLFVVHLSYQHALLSLFHLVGWEHPSKCSNMAQIGIHSYKAWHV
jgi:hypothetical protein